MSSSLLIAILTAVLLQVKELVQRLQLCDKLKDLIMTDPKKQINSRQHEKWLSQK